MFRADFKTLSAKPPEKAEDPTWAEQHFAKIAFAVSSFILFLFSPIRFLFSMAAGFFLHYAIEPNLKGSPPMIGSTDAVMAIMGAAAQMLKLTPAGKAGNFIFRSIPFICTLSIGSTAYKVFSAKR